MSGPIVRKYGFPNFEKIFGAREIQHGVEEPASQAGQAAKESSGAGQAPDPAQKPDTANRPESSGTAGK